MKNNTLTGFVATLACLCGAMTLLSFAFNPSIGSGFAFFFLFFTAITLIMAGIDLWPFKKEGQKQWQQRVLSASLTLSGILLIFTLPFMKHLAR